MATCSLLLPEVPVSTVAAYLEAGGGRGLERARSIGPDGVVDAIQRSGLRGRGGAGFPTGRKWDSVRRAPGTTKYVVCNAAEGEPGTFKDRAILRANPYQVVEGLAVAACAIGAGEVFLALKATFTRERDAVITAAQELEAVGVLSDLTVTIVSGPEEYLYGEESALLEVIEGRDPLPRQVPPYLHGLFATSPQLGWHSHEPERGHRRGDESNPTLVNNVETLANAAHILARGPEWFRSMGTKESPGTVVATVVGDVLRPGVVEVELGTPLREVIDERGGVAPDRRIKAVFSGVTNAVLPGTKIDVPLAHEPMARAGTGMGAAGFIVYDDTACMVDVARVFARFLWVESCGQCPACKLGTGRIAESLEALAHRKHEFSALSALHRRLRTVTDGNRCFLPVEAQQVVGSVLRAFSEDVVAHVEGTCSLRHDVVLPKLADLEDGVAHYDERQSRKRPDWTYAA
jgi:NADH:ubiquinone oxidoreductase subunit F (NADH-binding)